MKIRDQLGFRSNFSTLVSREGEGEEVNKNKLESELIEEVINNKDNASDVGDSGICQVVITHSNHWGSFSLFWGIKNHIWTNLTVNILELDRKMH